MLNEVMTDTISKFIRVKPTNLSLLITNMCNAQCIMCNIWQFGVSGETDLTYNQLKTILANPLLTDVNTVTFSGGEALLRKDIIDLVDLILLTLPKVRNLFIATNGLATGPTTQKITQILKRIQEVKQKKTCQLTVQVSYDGISEVHDKIRGPNAHVRVTKTLENLIELKNEYSNLEAAVACVVQPLNLQEVDQVKAYFKKKQIPYIFPIVCSNGNYYKNESTESIAFSKEELYSVRQFYSEMVKEEHRFVRKITYWDFLRILNGEQSGRGCPVMRNTLFLEPNGNLLPCLNSGDLTLGNAVNSDIGDLWFSKVSRTIIGKIQRDNCKTCMFACGISYLDGLRYFIWDSWRRTDLLKP